MHIFVISSRVNEGFLKMEFEGGASFVDHIHSVGPEVYGICACTFF